MVRSMEVRMIRLVVDYGSHTTVTNVGCMFTESGVTKRKLLKKRHIKRLVQQYLTTHQLKVLAKELYDARRDNRDPLFSMGNVSLEVSTRVRNFDSSKTIMRVFKDYILGPLNIDDYSESDTRDDSED